MYSHELARKLLEGPNLPILIDGIGKDLRVCENTVGYTNPYPGEIQREEDGTFDLEVMVIEVSDKR